MATRDHTADGNEITPAPRTLMGHGPEGLREGFPAIDFAHLVLAGGQQRVCTVERIANNTQLPMPKGKETGFKRKSPGGPWTVKWVLLTPAIYPALEGTNRPSGKNHPGGWLPNWIEPDSRAVCLPSGDTSRQPGDPREKWRQRIKSMPPVKAKLVAALVGRSIPVTGWALAHDEAGRSEGGAKATQLAVPAGSIYYFEADTESEAEALAALLNWHGQNQYHTIINRRSTLLGEKGFGLGVCADWESYAP
jgi:hypothetical protein